MSIKHYPVGYTIFVPESLKEFFIQVPNPATRRELWYTKIMALLLEEPYLSMLRRIVAEQIDTRHWQPVIFGSRAQGRGHRFSDIDLGFVGDEPLPAALQTRLGDALDESDIPYVVDIVDLTTAQPEFKQVAEQTLVKL
jgi:predicted nucleotidyltransferase